VSHAWSDLWSVLEKIGCDLHNFDPLSYQMTSIDPNNFILIHAIISWHSQMMIINGFDEVIWPMWVVLYQICGQGSTKIGCDLWFAQLLSQHPTRWHLKSQPIPFSYPCHHLLTSSDDDNELFWWGHLAHVSHAGSDLWSVLKKNWLWFFNFEQSSYQITSIEPTNSMLTHAIISWHAQMMIMNGFDEVIWPMSVTLGQICGQCLKRSCCDLHDNFNPLSYQMTSIESTNSILIHAIIFWHAQMMIINGFDAVIWPMWVMLGQICGQCSPKIGSDLPNFQAIILLQMTSIEPTNSMLIHAIISWHAQMMIMNGFELVIRPVWVMLGQICGQGSTKIGCDLPNFGARWHP
jgi:hypothetical protein